VVGFHIVPQDSGGFTTAGVDPRGVDGVESRQNGGQGREQDTLRDQALLGNFLKKGALDPAPVAVAGRFDAHAAAPGQETEVKTAGAVDDDEIPVAKLAAHLALVEEDGRADAVVWQFGEQVFQGF